MSNKNDFSWGAPVMSYGAPPMEERFPTPDQVEAIRKSLADHIKEIQGRGRAALRPPRPPVEKPAPLRLKKPYHVRRRVLFECGCETTYSFHYMKKLLARGMGIPILRLAPYRYDLKTIHTRDGGGWSLSHVHDSFMKATNWKVLE